MYGRNPTWTWDELLLALDVYLELDAPHMIAREAKVIALSNLLNELPIHDGRSQNVKFHNPTGVSMKLRNFLRFDPRYHGKRLGRGGRLEAVVWNEFAHNRARLHQTAQAIRETFREIGDGQSISSYAEDLDVAYPEGKFLYKVHCVRERNKKLIKKKKQRVREKTGSLTCEVCAFDFHAIYGELGKWACRMSSYCAAIIACT